MAKTGLPPWLLASIKHLASLHNPEFYQRQKLRLSTWQTPRFVRCYSEDLSHLHLPRGVLEPLRTLLESAGSRLDLADHRPMPAPLPARLQLKPSGVVDLAMIQASPASLPATWWRCLGATAWS